MKNFNRSISLLLIIAMVASLLSVSVFAAGYTVTVNGSSFDCEENKSGTGWSYSAEEKTLTLDNYDGGSIISGGDINICITGDTVVSGESSYSYGSSCCGISVNGTLNLTVEGEASAKISGAENEYIRGGDGIVATNLNISSDSSSSIEIFGGNSESAGGGFAVKASNVTLAAKNLVAKGGNGASALYFASKLTVESGCNATFVSGQKYVSAITYLSNAEYEMSNNVRSVFAEGGATVYFSTTGMFTYGDIFVDGFINAKDSVLLAQFLAKWELDLDESAISAADVFYDGKINATDAVLLAQYLASWSGITLGK